MDTHAILTADLLDVIFDRRNKEYGAYQLRRTYPQRIMQALFITSLFIAAILFLLSFRSKKQPQVTQTSKDSVVVIEIPTDLEPRQPEPPTPRQRPAAATKTQAFTINLHMVEDDITIDPMPEQTDFTNSDIGLTSSVGDAPGETVTLPSSGTGEEILPVKEKPNVIEETVDVAAAFDGNWTKFLLRHLDGNTPLNNDAPAGIYKVMIQFVVDLDGSISDLTPLTNHGYGLEEEAMRVLRKSKKWQPAIKNGVNVKSYRRQPVTFEVKQE